MAHGSWFLNAVLQEKVLGLLVGVADSTPEQTQEEPGTACCARERASEGEDGWKDAGAGLNRANEFV